MPKIITQLDLFRNTGTPLQGYKGWPWNYAGACVTAQAAVLRSEALDGLDVVAAYWRICWNPNINSGNQTAVRLVSANFGPSNLVELAATFSAGKTNSPLNEEFNITDKLKALIVAHISSAPFELIHQSVGDWNNNCLIYSSSIELVLNA